MAKKHTSEVAPYILAQKKEILEHIKQHCPDLQTLGNDVSEDELTIHVNESQGASKSTFFLSIRGHDFVLSAYTPEDAKNHRASIATQHAFADHLRGRHGIPVPQSHSRTLTLKGPDKPGLREITCEFTEFCRGRQVKRFTELTDNELRDLARNIARIHKAGQHFRADDMDKPFTLLARGLPHGMIHGDVKKAGNIIFDNEGKGFKGVIDFERMRYGAFADELGDLIVRMPLTRVTLDNHKFSMELDPKARLPMFLEAYETERPLSARERHAIDRAIVRTLWTRCNEVNQKHGHPLRNIDQITAIKDALIAFRGELESELYPHKTHKPHDLPDAETSFSR